MINPEALQNMLPDVNQQRDIPLAGTEQMTTPDDWITGVAAPTTQQAGAEEPFEFPFPEQWGDVSDFLTRMMETGMPTDVSGMSGALWDVYGQEAQRAGAEHLERAGLMGTRFGTPVGRRVGEEFARAGERVHAGALPFEYAAGEAARGRQMGAAGGLTGLGGQYLYAPMNIAQSMAGMGAGAQAAQQAEIDPIYANWLRETEEASPWLQYALGAFGGEVPYGPQMYEPGTSSQLMDMSSLFAMLQMLQGQGGG